MLKMYHENAHSGDTPDYWANSWDDIGFENALKLCETDPLLPLFTKYLRPESTILEGGCGKGHWVAYFAEKGYKIVGLDFAQRTLAELNRNRRGLMLCGGNVNALPFADKTFDIYYSGGVVEHFEAGCHDALTEAKRVLKQDGTLLLSVPYFSPLRRLLVPFRRKEWRELAEPEVDDRVRFDGLTYFQYAYRVNEFDKILARAGLRTIETMGYSIIWGLYDLKFLADRANRKRALEPVPGQKANDSSSHISSTTDGSSKKLLKNLLLNESSTSFTERQVNRLMRWSAANMMMFVCKREQ